MLLLPRLGWLQWLGAYSLTIYLYHILATSPTRRVLEKLEVTSPWIHVVVGTMVGIGLPIILHKLAGKWSLSRLMVLGLRDKKPAPRSDGAPVLVATQMGQVR